MKHALLILCSLGTFALADDISLKDGTVLKNAKITSQDAASISIMHDAGIARVMIPDLPAELRAKYNYDARAAAARLQAEDQATAARQAAHDEEVGARSAKLEAGSQTAHATGLSDAAAELQRQGILKLDPPHEKAWIDPIAWLACDAEMKENLTKGIAAYCNPEYPSITMLDKQSGKKLASYGPFQGFKIE